MPRTPDRVPGTSDEEATIYESTSTSTVEGEVRYEGTRFSMYDSIGEFDPRSGAVVPAYPGQVLYAETDTAFAARTPITSRMGWMVNGEGQLLVK